MQLIAWDNNSSNISVLVNENISTLLAGGKKAQNMRRYATVLSLSMKIPHIFVAVNQSLVCPSNPIGQMQTYLGIKRYNKSFGLVTIRNLRHAITDKGQIKVHQCSIQVWDFCHFFGIFSNIYFFGTLWYISIFVSHFLDLIQ